MIRLFVLSFQKEGAYTVPDFLWIYVMCDHVYRVSKSKETILYFFIP